MNLLYEFKDYEVKEDENNYIITGYGSVAENIDLGDDIVGTGAFKDDLKRDSSPRPALWQHMTMEPIGIVTSMEDSKGLYSKFKLPKMDTFVAGRVMPQVNIKSITGLSIGYSIVEYEMIMRDGKRCRLLKKLRLREISLVTFPMNEEARIIDAKKYLLAHDIKTLEEGSEKVVNEFKDYAVLPIETKWDRKKAFKQIRFKTDSQNEPSDKYKDGFMFFDSKNNNSFDSYKLPYVYVEGDEFKVVPKAIFAITAALSGTKGGVNISDKEKAKIKNQLNKYYEKMGKEPPFKKDKTYIDELTIKYFEKKDFHKLFEVNSNIILSSRAEGYIVDRIMKGKPKKDNSEIGNNKPSWIEELNNELEKI